MAADEKWYFTKEQLANTPSRRCGVDADKELSYRQQAANFIQNMGQRLYVSQLCINTAIVYMHRFYMFHSLTHFPRNGIATAALFLAAKVEEQPRKLEHVIKMGHVCLSKEAQSLDMKSDTYLDLAQNLVFNENALLVTLGFDVAIDHPHTHVVRCCHLVKASKDLAQTSYFMASNSLHLTTMCLQYKPTVVACFCIHLACKWSSMEIPESNEGKPWFWYVDKSVTSEMLSQLTGEFLHIFDKYPSRLKRKVRSISATYTPHLPNSSAVAPSLFDAEPRRVQSQTTTSANVNASVNANASANAIANTNSSVESVSASSQSNRQTDVDNNKKSSAMPGRTAVDYREYREKKERERLERERAAANSSATPAADTNKHHSHHSKQSSSTSVQPNKHSSSSSNNLNKSMHHNHHHRQDIKSQIIPQRHSTGSNQQSRDPSRDRQRPPHNHMTDGTNNLDTQTVHPPEKLTNNVHKSSHNNKPYARYSDAQSRSSRKPDILEQRSEEVRKIIEKPLPPPKPRAEILKEEYAAKMLKHSHYPSKYDSTTEKPVSNSTQPVLSHDNAKTLNVGQTAFTVAKSPNAPVPASQISQKSLSSSCSQIMPVKNGSTMTSSTSSFSLVSSFDDVMPQKKAENPPPAPVNKHRSLFSPEKTPTNSRESSHPQKSVKKVKTSPIVKDLNASLANVLHVQGGSEVSQQPAAKQRAPNNTNTGTTSSHKHRNSDIGYDQQAYRQQLVEDSKRFSMPTIGLHDPTGLVHNSIPPLIQPIRDSPKNTATPLVEVKTHQPQQHHSLSNGLESSLIKQEYSTIDSNFLSVKPELPDQLLSNEMPSDIMFIKQEQQKLGDFLNFHDPVFEPAEEPVRIKQESTMSISPLKSAQAISALLQEPLAPIPSLLQQPLSIEQHHAAREDSKPQQVHTNTLPMDNFVPSTVDISDLTGPTQCTVDVPARPATPVAELHSTPILAPIPVAPVNSVNATNTVSAPEEKKSEHRSKSEKKKEKKKHKHKEKKEEKKDKHKHKHKDKVKEKHHRDKSDKEKKTEDEGTSVGGNASVIGAAPIKITIPKDKLNLSTDSIGTSSATAPGSGLKIKIPKERLKVSDVAPPPALTQPQEPLKLKISKDQLARSNSNVHVFSQQESNNSSASGSKKRERSEPSEGIPPSKKQQQQPQPQQQQSQLVQQQLQQQQRSNERQNGRHSFANSDKVRGVGRGVGPRPNSHKFQHILNQPMRDAGYRGYHQPKRLPHHSRPLPPPPPHRTYFTNYPPAVQPPAYSYVAPPIFDHPLYYQYQQQDFGAIYQTAGGMMMTADGQIDTSVPPPSMQSMFSQPLQDVPKLDIDALISQPPPPPLPAGPPPSSSPPPPPPPE